MAENWQYWESQFLAPWAAKSSESRGRVHPAEPCPLRTCWQQDRDRIIHSRSFRRLKHKTQVFVNPRGDHFRTRLTHTLEVSQIARTIARALSLNEDLTEAIAMGHDLGHTPFGHAGERALREVLPGFEHREQSVRVVEVLENEGRGLNLTAEVKDGILHHSGEELPFTLEGQVVRLCDRIAYLNHDLADAIRSGYLTVEDVPAHIRSYLGIRHSDRINTMVKDVVRESRGEAKVAMSAACAEIMQEFRSFMFEQVYFRPDKVQEEERLGKELVALYHYYCKHPQELPAEYRREADLTQSICDYIAGMTDPFVLEVMERTVRR